MMIAASCGSRQAAEKNGEDSGSPSSPFVSLRLVHRYASIEQAPAIAVTIAQRDAERSGSQQGTICRDHSEGYRQAVIDA